jgi:hypothetical protein
VYARGDKTNPVVELKATGVSYGPIGSSVFNLKPPTGYHVVQVSTPAGTAGEHAAAKKGHGAKRTGIAGVNGVASRVPFKLAAPAKLVGLARQSASLLEMGGQPAALVTYGQGFGGIVVLEQAATASSTQKLNLSSGSGDHAHGIALPKVSIHGATAQELDTALGTVVRFTRGGVTFTVLGAVPPHAADAAARAL